MRKIKLIAVVTLVICCTFYLSTIPSTAKELSRYNRLKIQNDDYMSRLPNEEARALSSNVEITRNSNENSDTIKPVESMQGYIEESKLKNGVTYKSQELMTYESFINKFEYFDYNAQISKDRMIWVIVTSYPNGVKLSKVFINNAEAITYYDAETCEAYGFSIYSLKSNGEIDTNFNFGKTE